MTSITSCIKNKLYAQRMNDMQFGVLYSTVSTTNTNMTNTNTNVPPRLQVYIHISCYYKYATID